MTDEQASTESLMIVDLARKAGGDAIAAIKRTAELAHTPQMSSAILIITIAGMAGILRQSVDEVPHLLKLWNDTFDSFSKSGGDDAGEIVVKL